MRPLTCPFLALVAGIVAAPALDLGMAWLALPLSVAVASRYRAFALVTIGLVGALLASLGAPSGQVRIVDDGLPRRVLLRLDRAPEPGPEGISLEARVLEADGQPITRGRALLRYFPDSNGTGEIFEALRLGRGDTIEALVRLRRPNTYRNPGVFDYRRFLERQDIYWTGTLRSPRLVRVLGRGRHTLDEVRDWTAGRIARYFDDETTRALVLGMVLGRRNLLPAADERRFEEAGLIHLLVVSGFNLAVVAAASLLVSRWIFANVYVRATFALTLILAYALLVGGDPPVVRATIMAVWLIVGRMLDRGYAPGNALSGTAMVLLVVDPDAIADTSFLLSFGAVTAILLIGVPALGWLQSRIHGALHHTDRPGADPYLPEGVVDLRVALRTRAELAGCPVAWVAMPLRLLAIVGEVTVVTTGIQLLLLPFAIESFHRVAPISVPLNVLGAGVASMVTPPGLLLILLPYPLGELVAWILARLLNVLVVAVDVGLSVPGATMRVPSPPSILWVALALGVVVLIRALAERRGWAVRVGVAAVGAVLGLILFGDFSPESPAHPVLTILDVGQGDSILIEVPDGRTVVVDGGGVASSSPEEGRFRIGEDVVSQYLFGRGFRRIDTLVLTHAHHDHMDGLFDLIRNFEIGEVWVGPNAMVPRYLELLEAVAESGIPRRLVWAGDQLGPFRVLNPPRGQRVANEVRNDDSLVLLFDWRGRRALLTGDLERAIDVGPEPLDMLKVPHHGSRNTRLEVLARVPVISVGANNRFGHPDESRLPALRTDLHGAVEVTLEPGGPEVGFPGLDPSSLR